MGNLLRDLRLLQSLASQEMVDVVREIYPKYDKPLQSKCEAPDVYGVEIRPDALKALYKRFDPEGWEKRKKASDGHRFNCRISCRLDDVTYQKLMGQIRQDGFKTVQDWIEDQVLAYIKARCL